MLIDKTSDMIEDVHVYSVTDLNLAIKAHLEGKFSQVWLRGEISNFKVPPSGHFYFSLKDSDSQIRAVMFKGYNYRLKFRPEDGMEVIVKANVSVYTRRGDYQLICEEINPVGQGVLQAQFERLKNKLQQEGLFDTDRKKPLPLFPQRVALVTSPTGAVIKDLLNVLHRRFSGLEITLVPTLVQGDLAPAEIVRAIDLVHKVVPAFDVVVIARGGGSIEDLYCFNSEDVARSIAFSSIPTVSAIGHEVDFTIADFVADLRAPTPSVAAELIVPDKEDIQDKVQRLTSHLKNTVLRDLEKQREKYVNLVKRLKDPQKQLQEFFQRNDELLQRMHRVFQQNILFLRDRCQNATRSLKKQDIMGQVQRQKLQILSENLKKSMKILLDNKNLTLKNKMQFLDSLSPLRVVARGYSIVKGPQGVIVTSASQVTPGDLIDLTFAVGKAKAEIKKTMSS